MSKLIQRQTDRQSVRLQSDKKARGRTKAREREREREREKDPSK